MTGAALVRQGPSPEKGRKTTAEETGITCLAPIPGPEAQPRARGQLNLSVKPGARGPMLDGFRQSGSLRALFPRGPSHRVQGVLINTAGGITGGDRFDMCASAGPGTHLMLTTQAAERAYRVQPDTEGWLNTRLQAARGARLDWLPQETILFEGCALRRSLRVDLARDARLLMVEPLVFGRVAMGETLRSARFHDRTLIQRDGQSLFLDATILTGDITAHLARPFVADGAGAMALMVYVAPNAEAVLTTLRADLPATAGASLIHRDVLVARVLATDSFALRQALVPILNRLTGNDLPRPWMI